MDRCGLDTLLSTMLVSPGLSGKDRALLSSALLARLYLIRRRWAVWISLMLLLLVCLPANAAVGLSEFRAEADSVAAAIRLTWTTETEVNVSAFRVFRNTLPVIATATQVNQQRARGSAVGGDTYTFVDTAINRDVTYYYWLYELTDSGGANLLRTSAMPQDYLSLDGPSSAPPAAGTATPTAGATATPTRSATVTPTAMATQAPTQTPTPQPTASIAPNLGSPGAIATDLPTLTPTTQPTVAPVNPTPLPQISTATPVIIGQEPEPTPTSIAAAPPVVDEPALLPTEPLPEETLPAAGEESQPVSPTPTLPALVQAFTPAATMTSAAPPVAADPLAGLQARATATPRPATDAGSRNNARSLLLVVGGGTVCGAGVLALAAFVLWRRNA